MQELSASPTQEIHSYHEEWRQRGSFLYSGIHASEDWAVPEDTPEKLQAGRLVGKITSSVGDESGHVFILPVFR
jgi:hypothetical protein